MPQSITVLSLVSHPFWFRFSSGPDYLFISWQLAVVVADQHPIKGITGAEAIT